MAAPIRTRVNQSRALGNVLSVDVDTSAAVRAAASLAGMTGRGNSIGHRQLINPRDVVSRRIPEAVDFAQTRIVQLTPNKRIAGTITTKVEVANGGTAEDQAAGLVRAARSAGQTRLDASGDFARYRIDSDLPEEEQIIVSVMEFGSKPHVIRAKRGSQTRNAQGRFQRAPERWMRIPVSPKNVLPGARVVREKDGTQVVYVKQVNHPGTPPRAMFRRTLIEIIPMADVMAREIVQEVVADWQRRALL
jgi:hypothetical protein